jgi:hypothetical protein
MSATTTKAAPAHKATPHAVKPEVEHLEPTARVGTVTKAVNRVIDRYERDVARFVKLEHRAANATQIGWMKSALDLHATFVEDMSAVYVKTTRAVLR